MSEINGEVDGSSKSILSFVTWTASIFVYLCFVAWALLPGKTLHYFGVTYYPSRYYAVALPAYVLVVYLLSGVAYIGLNLFYTLDPEDKATIRDIGPTALTGGQMVAPLSFIKTSNVGTKDNGIPDIGDLDPIQLSSLLVDGLHR